MDVIATPVSILPQVTGNAAATDISVGDAVANLPTGDIFGDMLAKQLGLVMSALQLPGMADAKPGILADAPADKTAPDAAELAAQLQAAMTAQLPVDGSVIALPPVIQPPISMQAAETAAEGVASPKIGEIAGQQRQVIAAVDPELAAMKRAASIAEAEQVTAGKTLAMKGQAAMEKGQQAAFSHELAAAGKAQTATASELAAAGKAQTATASEVAAAGKTQTTPANEIAAMRHAATISDKQPLPSAASVDAQPTPAAFSQMLSGQQSPAISQSGLALPGAVIQAPVSSPAWGAGLGDKVVWMVGQQHQGVELHLNPPALGPLEVRVSMSDGQANLSFMTQHLPVREAIEAATSRLREMLGDSGISMGSVSVNVGTFAQQQSPAQSENGRSAPIPRQADSDPAFFPGASVAAIRPLHGNGMVDIFA